MEDLVRQGKVLYWGTSMWSAQQLSLAHHTAARHNAYAPIVEQPRYNLVHREIERGVLPRAEELGMGLVVWSPLAQGLLTGKYNDGVPEGSRAANSSWLEGDLTEDNLERVRAFSAIAEELGATPAQLALAWCLSREQVSSVITGATRVAQLEDNLGAVELSVDEALIERLDELFEPAPPSSEAEEE